MGTKKDDIIQLLLSNQGAIRSFCTQRIGLFGSFNKGTNTDESDIDLLVEFEAGEKTCKSTQGLIFF